MAKVYAYAVMDGNEAPDQYRRAQSCHHTFAAASKAARKLNRADANAHYYVVDWDATRASRDRPNENHFPCDEWRDACAEDNIGAN